MNESFHRRLHARGAGAVSMYFKKNFPLRDFIFKKTLFEKLQYLKQEQ